MRLAIVVLLFISGAGKLLDGREASQFLIALANSHPVAEKWADDFISGLSIFEIVLAGSLLHRKSVRIGLSVLSGILVVFSIALAMMLARNVPLDSCGCSGAFGGELTIEIALLRNLILLVAVVGCYLLLATNPRPGSPATIKSP
ncbi:MAG: hypothetical protein ONB44_16370 [candidate division KSB1 bacterium]|nr:hypothetical protein [candidate division KSB1 bacterium]MDZ7303709.1 hypothetical protein [candidate division KSB1 bacterium]MDZ7313155.1 hypothetical protein [candidate division KSB1 bacterium]